MSILITAASHAAAYKIERILKYPEIIFADYLQLPQMGFQSKKLVKIPAGNSSTFAHELLNLALNEGINQIFPLYAEEILPLSESKQLFSEYGIMVMVPSLEWLEKSDNQQVEIGAPMIIIENGKIIASETPVDLQIIDSELSGIFNVVNTGENPRISLFKI